MIIFSAKIFTKKVIKLKNKIDFRSSAKNKHTKSDSDESAKKKPKLNPVVLSQETPSTSTAQVWMKVYLLILSLPRIICCIFRLSKLCLVY